MLLEETPAVLSLGKLCEDHGYTYHWTSGQKPHLTQNGKRIAKKQTMYHSLSLVYRRVLPQHPHTYFFNIVIAGFCNQHGKSRYRKKWKYERGVTGKPDAPANKGDEEVQSDLLHDLPDWPQEFTEFLVDERSPLEPREDPSPGDRDTSSSSHELPMESRKKRVEPGSGKQCVYTHFPKDRNCDVCLKTKTTRASCRRRAGTVVPRGKIWWFNDWITKFLASIRCCGTRFGNSVVTILRAQNKNFSGDPEEPNEVRGADEEAKSHWFWQFFGIWQVFRGIILESLYVNTSPFRNKCDCWESSA